MKKYFLIPMLGLILVCCTKEREVNNGDVGGDPNVSAVTNYLTISIVAAGNAGSRADNNGSIADDETYETGDGYENNVKMIRFYFFDNKGNAAPAWKLNGSKAYESFIDWYPSTGSVQDPEQKDKDETVEKIVKDITLGINMVESMRPTQILAIVNPTTSLLNLKKKNVYKDSDDVSDDDSDDDSGLTVYGMSLNDILGNETDANYLTGLKHSGNSDNSTEGNFVMSNSVYIDDNKTLVKTVELTPSNFRNAENPDETPVIIYVERVVARLDLTNSLSNEAENVTIDGKSKTIYKLDSYTVEGEKEPNQTGKKDIYVLLNGWNVTTTPTKSRLVKEISQWDAMTFFGNAMLWNVPAFHRSFWAINPETLGEEDYQYGMFDKDAKDKDGKLNSESHPNPANGYAFPVNDATARVYMQENAGKSEEDASTYNPTNVIIAAQLVDKDGNPYELAEWAYKKYTLDNLKTLFANETLRHLYTKTGNEYDKITPADITFKTFSQAYGTEDADDNGRYYVYPVLTDAAATKSWFLKDEGTGTYASYTTQQVNIYMRDHINHVKVWKEGLTYYYFDIKHLAKEGNPGDFGVVRNHIYQAVVKSIAGLGTPVYDPDNEVIIPEKPEDDESIITAEVKILQWRIVNAQYDIQWPN